MKENEPPSGAPKVWLATAARALSIICALSTPASAHSVRFRYCGSTLRTAGGLKQLGARSFGFQNSASSKLAAQERSTKHTKPLLPLTAVAYPCLPSTSASASAEIEGGAAVRASVISSCASAMRYCSTGAIAG